MPIVAFACPSDKKKYGEIHEPEYCVVACDEQCYSPFLMTAIYGVNQRNHHKGRYVSATALSGCKRRLHLERTVDYAEEYKKLYAAFRGTITHTVIEEALHTKFASGRSLASLGFIAEWNMIVGFCMKYPEHGAFSVDPDADPDDLAFYAQNGCPICDDILIPRNEQEWILLGGTLDGGAPVFRGKPEHWIESVEPSIYVDAIGTAHYKLSDLKTMKEYALSYFVKGDPKNQLHPQIKDDYVKQARVYAYLASRARVPAALAARGIKRIKMVRSDIQAFAMGEAPWTGAPTFRWRDGKGPLKDWPMHAIDLGDEKWIEAYIFREARPILDSLIYERERAPVRSEDQAWLCADYCSFGGTEFCPNPEIEAELIKQGVAPEEAFAEASEMPWHLPEKFVAPLSADDTRVVDNFFRRQRGEAEVEKAAKPKKEPKPRTKKAKKPNQEAA
jgi:hypothetical protein